MSRFLNALRSGAALLMDGAMGTELRQAGPRENECAEHWNLTHPDQVREIHRSYRQVGSQCFLTNTFQSHPEALQKHGLEDQLEVFNKSAVALARSVPASPPSLPLHITSSLTTPPPIITSTHPA